MRHIMIDPFASSLGHSYINLISTTFSLSSKIDLLRHFVSPQDYILTRPFPKRESDILASRSWNLCASLLIDTTVAPADVQLCKDADVSRRSFHCSYIIHVCFNQTVLHAQLSTAALS